MTSLFKNSSLPAGWDMTLLTMIDPHHTAILHRIDIY